MSRPTGWDVLDLDEDPTPGDAWTVADLQRRWANESANWEHDEDGRP